MKLGFIGTGVITEAMVRGLCGPGGHQEPIHVTERSRARSQRLAAAFANVTVLPDTQTVVDQSDWVIVALRPEHASGILSSLHFRPRHRVISLVAGLHLQTVASTRCRRSSAAKARSCCIPPTMRWSRCCRAWAVPSASPTSTSITWRCAAAP